MIIAFQCPLCRTDLEVQSEEVGDESQCPSCRELIMIPAAGVGPGTIIGNFEIVKKIGSGGMGQVYRAYQPAMDRHVALKVLPPAMTKNVAMVERFMNEVRTSGRLEHRNIVSAIDAGQDDGYYYMAMSLVDGQDFDDWVHSNGPMPEAEALYHCRNMASALDYAWSTHRMLHRDIKPSNIMVDKAGDTRLMDMGIAKCLNDERANMTIAGMMIGTPYYMSPEQATSQTDIDCRADIYSLGATLYFMLTATRPFEGDSVMSVVSKVLKDPIPPIQVRNPAITDQCADLIGIMMNKDREDRPKDWRALIQDIDMVLNRQPPRTVQLKMQTMASMSAKSDAVSLPPGLGTPSPKQGETLEATIGLKQDTTKGTVKGIYSESSPFGQTVSETSATAPRPTRSVLDSDEDSPDMIAPVKRVLMLGGGLFIVLALMGILFFYMKLKNEQQSQFLKDKVNKTEQELAEQRTIGDVEAALSTHQTKALVEAEEKKRLKNLDEMFKYAQEYARVHPEEKEAAIKKYEAIREQAHGTKYALMVDDAIDELLSASKDAAGAYMGKLAIQARGLLNDHRMAEARALLEDANAPFQAETQERRARLLADVAAREARYDLANAVLRPELPNLINFRFAAALKAVEDAAQDRRYADAAAELSELANDLAHLKAMPDEVAKQLRSDIGKDIKVVLNGRIQDARLTAVNGTQLSATLQGTPRSFGLSDLHPADVYRRLKDSQAAGAEMMRALAAMNGGRPDFAFSELSETHSLLASLVIAEAERQLVGGTWKAASFGGPRYSGQITSMLVAFNANGSYRMVLDDTIVREGSVDFRRGALYFQLAGRAAPDIWTIEWRDKTLVMSPREGIEIVMQKSAN